jgi:hypothetical protein
MPRRTPRSEVVKILTEATLVVVLFSDAYRIGLYPLRADLRLCLRLLGIGLPLAIGLGTLLAFIVPEVSDIWRALAIGAALAPTDAGLGAGMMVNRAVPGQDPAADQRRERAHRRDRHPRSCWSRSPARLPPSTPPAPGPGRRWPNWRSAC